jgi:DNA-binding beta-propeller fold protein YncE
VKLPGAPEGFVAEPGGGRVFVNLPKAGKVAVIDREQNAVTAEWELPEGARGNYAMAMDVEKQRLFVACRKPARLFVLDAATGKSVASLECAGDADDVWFDAGATKRVFVVGGAGSGEVTAIKQEGADSYSADFKVKTAPGARTGVLVPEMRKLIVAAPNSGDDPGYVFFYLIAP